MRIVYFTFKLLFKFISILFLLGISLNSFSQKDSLLLTNNAKNEINLRASYGKQSLIKYHSMNGKNMFLNSTNHAWEVAINYSTRIGQKQKFSIGFLYGAGSLEMPYEITTTKFPGLEQFLGQDFNYGSGGVLGDYFGDSYFAIPIKVYHNILNINRKHKIWLSAGIDFQYLTPSEHIISNDFLIDSLPYYYTLYTLKYSKNPNHVFSIRFNLGLEYRFQLPNYHELIFGVNYAFHTKDMYTGYYETLQFDPYNAGSGIFTNKMNLLSFNLGYSINTIRRRYKQIQKHKNNSNNLPTILPDTSKNTHEFRFGTNPKLYAWNKIDVPNTAASLNSKVEKFQYTSFTFHYLKYIAKNTAWYTGLDADFGYYNFYLTLSKKDYTYLKQSYIIKHREFLHFLNIPFGLHHNIIIGKKSNLEISSAATLSFNLASSMSTGYMVTTTNSTYITLFNVNVDKINFITPGGQLNIGYSYETKRKNKWIIGLRGTMNFIKSYSMDYEILNPDKSYYSNNIDMQPFNFQLYWRYALTGKRKRYLKAVGY